MSLSDSGLISTPELDLLLDDSLLMLSDEAGVVDPAPAGLPAFEFFDGLNAAQGQFDGDQLASSEGSPQLATDPSNPYTSSASDQSNSNSQNNSANLEQTGCKPSTVASRNYRQKQRVQFQHLEQQLHKITEQFSQLYGENTALKQRLQVLEAVVPLREQQLAFAAELVSAQKQTRVLDPVALLSEASFSQQKQAPSAAFSGIHPNTTAAPNTLPSATHSTQAAYPSSIPNTTQPTQPGHAQCTNVLNSANAAAFAASKKFLTDEEYRQMFIEFNEKAALPLHCWETRPTPDVATKLDRLVREFMEKTILACASHDPEIFMRNLYINLETGTKEVIGDEFWMAIAQQLRLTAEQLGPMKITMQMHDEKMASIMRERQAIVEQLSQAMPEAGNKQQDICCAAEVAEVDALMARMQNSLLKEKFAYYDAMDFMSLKVLTAPQLAKAVVASHPFIPDALAIAKAALQAADQQKKAS